MRLPCEAPPPDAPGVAQGGRGRRAHVQVGAMAVALQAAQAALPGGRAGGRGAGGPSTASDKALPCAGCVDDGCVADLVRGWCNPAAVAAIVADLGWAAADATAVLVGGGEGGGGTTTEGGGGGIEGWIIVLVIVDIAVNVKVLTLMLTSPAMMMVTVLTLAMMVAELKPAESRTAISGTGRDTVALAGGRGWQRVFPLDGR
jgi:hypothetical protein